MEKLINTPVVYKLSIDNYVYIGMTNNFELTINRNRNDFFRKKNNPLYNYIRNNNKNFNDIKVEILENLDHGNRKYALQRKAYHIQEEKKDEKKYFIMYFKGFGSGCFFKQDIKK
jgi:hypothetical protein